MCTTFFFSYVIEFFLYDFISIQKTFFSEFMLSGQSKTNVVSHKLSTGLTEVVKPNGSLNNEQLKVRFLTQHTVFYSFTPHVVT